MRVQLYHMQLARLFEEGAEDVHSAAHRQLVDLIALKVPANRFARNFYFLPVWRMRCEPAFKCRASDAALSSQQLKVAVACHTITALLVDVNVWKLMPSHTQCRFALSLFSQLPADDLI